MANYIRKTKDVWVLEENWGYGDGWEYIGEYEDKHSANVDLRKYQEDIRLRMKNGDEVYSVRLRKTRVKREGVEGDAVCETEV